MAIDIGSLIFETILKISPELMSRYSTVQDQLLYLLLIPMVIIVLFLWSFGYWVSGRAHAGIRIMVSMIAFIYIIWSGWYGSIIVPILLAWFPLMLGSMFIFFIMSHILPPLTANNATKVMKAMVNKAAGKPFETRRLQEEIQMLEKSIKELKKAHDDAMSGTKDDDEQSRGEIEKAFSTQIAALQVEMEQKKLALKQTQRLV